MSGKQEKKIRQLIRRNQSTLVNNSWDCFFETVSNLTFRYRFKLAWKILLGNNIRQEEKLRK